MLMLVGSAGAAEPAAPAKPGHVFIIVLENEGYHVTFGTDSPAAYLKGLAQSEGCADLGPAQPVYLFPAPPHTASSVAAN